MVRPMSVPPSVREVDGPRPRAVVVGVQLPRTSGEAFESSLKELERLAHTLGLQVVARVTQHRSALVTATVVGAGKLKQLGDLTGGGACSMLRRTRQAEGR